MVWGKGRKKKVQGSKVELQEYSNAAAGSKIHIIEDAEALYIIRGYQEIPAITPLPQFLCCSLPLSAPAYGSIVTFMTVGFRAEKDSASADFSSAEVPAR